MPSPERPGGAEPFRRSPEREPLPPYQAARFAEEEPSRLAYVQAQELIRQAAAAEVSSFRLQLNRQWHVALLGSPPSPEFIEEVNQILSTGEPAVLPLEVVRALTQRRAEMTQRHPGWVERHHKPGKRFRL